MSSRKQKALGSGAGWPPGASPTGRPGRLGVAGILPATALWEAGERRKGGTAYKHVCATAAAGIKMDRHVLKPTGRRQGEEANFGRWESSAGWCPGGGKGKDPAPDPQFADP